MENQQNFKSKMVDRGSLRKLNGIIEWLLSGFLQINPGEVEALLSRLPCTFRQEMSGVGASLEKRWNFCGFQGIKST